MYYKIIIDLLTAFGTVGAVAIGMVAIYHTNKNSKREIKTHKFEEAFELIQSLSKYYGQFKELNFCIEDLRSQKNIRTLQEYYQIRDEKLTSSDRQKIISDLSRLEVLSKCYMEGSLLKKTLIFEDLIYSFSDFVFNGGSIHRELKWKNGFPDYEEFHALIEDLKKLIIDQITRK